MKRRQFVRQWPRLSNAAFAVLLGWTCMMVASAAGAQQREDPAQIVLAADLRESPQRNAAVIASLPAGESVMVRQMSGAWSRIKAKAGEGWVLSSRLQVGGPAQASDASSGARSDAGGTSWLRGLTGFLRGSGSTRSSGGNVTIGTRGLQSEDVAGAKPDPAAVAQLDHYIVEAADASAQANAAGLQAIDVAYLDAPEPAQSDDVFSDVEKD
ncbi:MAG: hypothetical protein ACI9DC_003299 [Gammaproteobacteria bacterium]|jgi:hypothetical protein